MKTKHPTTTPLKPPRLDSITSPSQPPELSVKDRARLKEYLDRNDKPPFTVTTVPISRKRKRESGALLPQQDLFDERLSVNYEVKPANNWESMKKYKKFTVQSESIAVGECILVSHDDKNNERSNVDPAAGWKARVLEVRALDSEHVYLRVSWLNRPEDLEDGRKPYHGKNELIPSNQMDIIDAMATNGLLKVYHWNEEDDEAEMPDPEEYFWRQTYDFAGTKTFSKLRSICRDQNPQNPDEMILQCSNKDCRKWMHVKCIAEDAVERAGGAGPVPSTKTKKRKSLGDSAKKKGRAKDMDFSPSCSAGASNDSVSAEVFVADSPKDNPAKATEIVITDAEGEKRSEAVRCLLCGEEVE